MCFSVYNVTQTANPTQSVSVLLIGRFAEYPEHMAHIGLSEDAFLWLLARMQCLPQNGRQAKHAGKHGKRNQITMWTDTILLQRSINRVIFDVRKSRIFVKIMRFYVFEGVNIAISRPSLIPDTSCL